MADSSLIEAPAAADPLAALVQAALGERSPRHLRRAAAAYVAGTAAWKAGRALHKRFRASREHTVMVRADDDLFVEVQRWLVEQIPAADRRHLMAQTTRRGELMGSLAPGERPETPRVHLAHDGRARQTVTLGGHRVAVEVERPSFAATLNELTRDAFLERLVFRAADEAGRDAVIAMLGGLAAARIGTTPRMYMVGRWQEWQRYAEVRPRPLETVVLGGSLREELAADLRDFLGREADYARLGIPWHRGYLFAGPPGTGKSSIAQALAGHLGLDVYLLPLGAPKDNAALGSLLNSVPPRSMLVLEDVDIAHASHGRDDQGDRVTLDGLLNALDGMVTPHGLVHVMTTNRPDVLDEALVRPGRVDVRADFGYLDADQLHRLLRLHVGDFGARWGEIGEGVSPADVVGVLKRHLDDPAGALPEIGRLVAQEEVRV